MTVASSRPTAVNTSRTRASIGVMRFGQCACPGARCPANLRRRRSARARSRCPPTLSGQACNVAQTTVAPAVGSVQAGGLRTGRLRLAWGNMPRGMWLRVTMTSPMRRTLLLRRMRRPRLLRWEAAAGGSVRGQVARGQVARGPVLRRQVVRRQVVRPCPKSLSHLLSRGQGTRGSGARGPGSLSHLMSSPGCARHLRHRHRLAAHG